jgi:FkbM family methyltransferase
MIKNELVYDLGFHNGDDTHFYLTKGYKVIAVEANPNLVLEGQKRFASEIATKRLTLINNAISSESGEVKFYVHPTNSDWSSCFHDIVTSDGSSPLTFKVRSSSLYDLYEKFGVPHYLKVDVEGADVFVAKQLFEYKIKPEYVSFETSRRDFAGLFSYLYVAGYTQFQLVNQANNNMRKVEINSLDGNIIRYEFTKYSSGLFGSDLPSDRWHSFEEILSMYIKYKELKQIDNKELGLGWVDIHARYNA